MLKSERQQKILYILENKDYIKVNEISCKLNVTNMTIRRDLETLEKRGLIIRVQGGARLKPSSTQPELSHLEKSILNIEEKIYIAKISASFIENGDTIFLGGGTTIELIINYIGNKQLRILTNSLPVFQLLKNNSNIDLILVGGKIRIKTSVFVGTFAEKTLSKVKVNKMFIGTNGIKNLSVTNSNEEDGNLQQIVMENTEKIYILCDHNKFGIQDFFITCTLNKDMHVITDQNIQQEKLNYYNKYTSIIN